MDWGIIGAGDIARKFVDNARRTGSDVVAVGSRSEERARRWADDQQVRDAHGSSAALVENSAVQCVYIATNHVDHVANAMLAVAAGRHVLVEKPLGVTRAQVRELTAAGAQAGVTVMEAMWTRFLPAWTAIIDLVAAGRIGRVQSARIRLGNAADPSVRARSRLFDAARAGGALLDTGIYPLSIAHMVLGPGQVVRARATLLDGVDVHTWITADHDGVPVELETAIDEDLDSTAAFLGTDGEIHVPAPCHHPTGFRLVTSDGDRWVDAPYDGGGFEGQIAAFEAAVGQGRSEVPAWPHAATLATHGLLDDVRRRIGLQFHFEQGLP